MRLKLLAASFLFAASATAQIQFSSIPDDLQFFSRDESGYGHFTLSGRCTDDAVDSIFIQVFKDDDSLVYKRSKTPDSERYFSMDVRIRSAPAEYELRVYYYKVDNDWTLIRSVKGLV